MALLKSLCVWLFVVLVLSSLSVSITSSLVHVHAQGNDHEDDTESVVDDDEMDDILPDDLEIDDDEDEDVDVDEGDGADAGAVTTSEDGEDDTYDEDDDEEYEEEEEEEEEEIVLEPSPDVDTVYMFPTSEDKRFHVGSEIELLFGFTNNGELPLNISVVGAFLHSPYDFTYYIQNFTTKPVEVVVEPSRQTSISYTVQPDASLEPLEFWFSAFVLYNNSNNEPFRSTLYNGTVEIIEKPSNIDVRAFFTYSLALAGVGLAVYIGFNVMKSVGSRKVETGTHSWDADIYRPSKTSKPVGRKKKHKKKSKPKQS